MTRVMFPFRPNWRDSYSVARSFKTDVFTAEAGGESRRALRVIPRRSVEFSLLTQGQDFQQYQAFVRTSQNMPVVMPDFSRCVSVASVVGAVVTLKARAPMWVQPGMEVILEKGSTRVVGTVAAVMWKTVTLAEPVGGGVRMYEALTGKFDQGLSTKVKTSRLGDTAVQFTVEPGSDLAVTGVAGNNFQDREVFSFPTNWAGDFSVSNDWPVQTIDYGFGRRTVFSPIDFPKESQSMSVLARSADEAEWLLGFFQRMRGCCGEFIRHTGIEDMEIVSIDDTTAVVRGDMLRELYADDPIHKAIYVKFSGGVEAYRGIVEKERFGNNDTLIVLDEPWPAEAYGRDIIRCSWARVNRLLSDDLTMEWQTPEIATCRLGMVALPMADPHDYAQLRVTTQPEIRAIVGGDERTVIYL